MRRKELVDAVNELTTALKETGLSELLGRSFEEARSGKGDTQTAEILTALNKYSIRANSFNAPTKELVKILGLTRLC